MEVGGQREKKPRNREEFPFMRIERWQRKEFGGCLWTKGET